MSLQKGQPAQTARADLAPARTGGQILVDQLLIHGVDMAFCVPGESYLAVLDALYGVRDRIKLINARHEAGAANMAEAYGKLTGKPGIALVTRGPGACHAAIGVHTARQDSTPLILLVGQIGRGTRDREAFQEIDYRRMFALHRQERGGDRQRRRAFPEYLARAFHEATSGRPGPVVLSLPEDMLTDTATVADAKPYVAVQPAAAPADMARLRDMLARAERPLMIVGGYGLERRGVRRDRGVRRGRTGLPAACSFRRQDVFDNGSPCFVGDLSTSTAPTLVARAKAADLLLVVGSAPRRDDDPGLRDHGSADAAPAFRPRLSGPRRDRPRFSARSRHRLVGGELRRRRRRHAAGRRQEEVERLARGRAPGIPRLHRAAGDELSARHGPGVRRVAQAPARGLHRHPRRRQLHRLGAALFDLSPALPAARAHVRGHGLFGAGGDRSGARPPRTGSSSAASATAASS